MIRIQLPDAEAESLERALRATLDAKLRHRVQIVLMAHRGPPHPEIAADTDTSPRSVQRWLNAYLDGGLDRLRSRKAKGATPRPTTSLRPCGSGSSTARRSRGWAGPAGPTPSWPTTSFRPRASGLGSPPCRPSAAGMRSGRTGRPTASSGATRRSWPWLERSWPTLRRGGCGRTGAAEPGRGPLPDGADALPHLGVKGHRPVVGTRVCKYLVYVFVRRLQEASAAHLRHVVRVDPGAEHKRVVVLIDNAPGTPARSSPRRWRRTRTPG